MARDIRIGIGAEIRRVRRAAGLTQAALAGRLGIHPNSVTTWEHDAAMPSDEALRGIQKVTGVWLGAYKRSAVESLLAERAERRQATEGATT